MGLADKTSAVFGRDILLRLWVMLTSIVIARILGPANVGIWYILLMIPAYAEPLGRLKLDVASVYYLNNGKYKLGEVYFNLVIVSLLSGGAIVLLFFWQREFILVTLLKNSLDSGLFVNLMLISVPLRFITVNYSYLFLSKEDVIGYNVLGLIAPVVSAALGIFLLMTTELGLLSLVISMLTGEVMGLIYSAIRFAKTDKIVCCINMGMLKEFFLFSWKLYLSNMARYFQIYISGILVAMYLLPKDVTFYKMGQQKALLLSMIGTALSAFLYPLVAREDKVHADEITAKACRIGFLILVFLTVIGAVFIKPAVYFLYGADYLPQVLPFLILLPGVIFYSASTILSSYFLGRGRTGILLALSLIPLVLQVILCMLLIPLFGVRGAALTASLSYFIMGSFYIFVFMKMAKMSLWSIIIPKKSDFILITGFAKKRLLGFLPGFFTKK